MRDLFDGVKQLCKDRGQWNGHWYVLKQGNYWAIDIGENGEIILGHVTKAAPFMTNKKIFMADLIVEQNWPEPVVAEYAKFTQFLIVNLRSVYHCDCSALIGDNQSSLDKLWKKYCTSDDLLDSVGCKIRQFESLDGMHDWLVSVGASSVTP